MSSANRFNVSTASREELVNVVKHLHSKVAELQGQLKTQQSTTANQNTAGGGTNNVNANNSGTASVASSIANFFTSSSSSPSQANQQLKNNSKHLTDHEYYLSDEAKSKIESLETELETERSRHAEDIEIMQQQIDQLTIRAADDAEAIDKLRKAADDIKSLASKQQQQNSGPPNGQNKLNSIFGEETKNVVDDVASSFATAMVGLADERDLAKLERQKVSDDNDALRTALRHERKRNSKLLQQIETLEQHQTELQNKNETTDQRIERGKEISRKKYDKLYERFMLLRKRFDKELEFGPLSSSNQGKNARSCSSTSSSSSIDSPRPVSDDDPEKKSAKQQVGIKPDAATTIQQHHQQYNGARKALVFKAAHLLHDDDDDDNQGDDENDLARIVSDKKNREAGINNNNNNGSNSNSASASVSAIGSGGASSIAAGLAIARAWQQQNNNNNNNQNNNRNSPPLTLPVVANTKNPLQTVESFTQTDMRKGINDQESRAGNGIIGSLPVSTASSIPVVEASGFTGSIGFDHDLSILMNWDAEDIRALKRLLNY